MSSAFISLDGLYERSVLSLQELGFRVAKRLVRDGALVDPLHEVPAELRPDRVRHRADGQREDGLVDLRGELAFRDEPEVAAPALRRAVGIVLHDGLELRAALDE